MQHHWRNWLGNHSARPQELAAPDDVAGVVACVERAAARGQAVRVVSGGYCWSPLVPCDGMILSIEKLRRIRHIDRERQQITIETGAPLRDLVLAAAEHGLSVHSPAMFMGLTVGGLIATGSHGTGGSAATVGDAVVAYELVTASGEVIQASDVGSDRWRAVITNLGALGVVTAVTLQCEPLYNVLEVHEQVHYMEAAPRIAQALDRHEFASIFWSPAGGIANFKLGNRTDQPATPTRGRMFPTWQDKTIKFTGRYLPRLVERVPVLTEVMASLVSENIGTGSQVVREPDFSHYQQIYPPVISSEFAVPIERAGEAWAWVVERLMQYWRSGIRPVNMVVHARFGRPSAAWIASSAGRRSCHLEVLCLDGNRHRHLFASELDEKMRGHFGGRPHWGKDIARPWLAAATHGRNMDAFLDIRRDLDPKQRFLNPYLRDEVFGLGRRVVRVAGLARSATAEN
ncbi:MAG: FAD-binding protein [Deltaproteobacteria bacterium]|nr:FAD-binding protein [Deltaproteobacteria bacterium]